MTNSPRYQLHKWIEVKSKSRAGVEYTKFEPEYYNVSKEEFYKSFNEKK